MSKEIIIDKTTNIKKIENKDKYEVLTLKSKVNPKKLKDFTNIKVLIIDYANKYGENYNEQNINELIFKNNLEKVIFKQFKSFGCSRRNIYDYDLKLPNVRSIEFPGYIYNNYTHYLDKVKNIEEIIFNIDKNKRVYLDSYIFINSNVFNRIIIKYKEKEYEIIPEYEIDTIDELEFDTDENTITLEYSDDHTETEVIIDVLNDTIKFNNNFEIHEEGGTIYIPDYATDLNDYDSVGVNKISLNLNLLKYVEYYDDIIKNYGKLKTIELRSNNEMSLMGTKEINVDEHGKLKELYIVDYLLVLEYDCCKITIDNKGTINKEIIKKTAKIEDILDTFSLEELHIYSCFLKLLRESYDPKYQNAMKVVEETLIKKYKK